MIYGKWVSNYKDKDSVLVVTKEYKLLEGKLNFVKEYFTEDCNIIIDNEIYAFSDFLLICNTQDSSFYEENTHLLYKALFDKKDQKIKQLMCEHEWEIRGLRKFCRKCKVDDHDK